MKKTKLIPIAALVFAIAAAVASSPAVNAKTGGPGTPTPSNVTRPPYQDTCQNIGGCTEKGSAFCYDGTLQLYKILSSTSCTSPARGLFF